MRNRLAILMAAAGIGMLAAASPAEASCGYNPCYGRAQSSYGYNYGYQYQQPYYQQQYAQPYYQQQYYQQPVYQRPAYQQPAYYQQPVYQQPAYQQPYYPQAGYAAPCCEPNWWEKLWGTRNCCQQGYAQTSYAAEPRSDWNTWSSPSWSGSNREMQINNNGPVYVMRDGVSMSGGFGADYAYANAGPVTAETYVQPAPRYYRKRVYRTHYGARPRVVVRTVYKTRVVYVRPKPRPHVLVPGNPSTSAGTYEVAPKKVLRP